MEKQLELLIDGNRGIYIPQIFAQRYGEKIEAQQPELKEDIITLEQGPEGEEYWWAWDAILSGEYLDDSGNKFTLYQDGDLWLVPDGYEWPEE